MDMSMDRYDKAVKKSKAAQISRKCSDTSTHGMDRFFALENIALYRALANKNTNAVKRARILDLLNEEEREFKLELRSPLRNEST